MTKTQEDHVCRDISAIKKSLQSIAEDLRYFRKKDEAAAAEKEESKYTCKDCSEYQRVLVEEPNEMMHWCTQYQCPISEEGLEKTCPNFVKNGEF